MDPTMEKKLRETIDRQDILQVLQRYGRGLDRLDVEMARSVYFEDAIDDHGNFIGYRDDFIEWANESSLLFVAHHHGIMNHYCELDGDDAYTETYYLFTGVRSAPPHLLTMGRYIDHFQRRKGEWRIANRVKIHEGAFDLHDSTARLPSNPPYGPEHDQLATRDRRDASYRRPPVPRRPV